VSFHDPTASAPFRSDKPGKATLWRSDAMMLGVNALEPGQAQDVHAHDGQDKAYVVVSGRGRFTVGDERREVSAGGVVVAPAGVPHGVVNDSGERLLVLVVMAPPPGAG